MDPAPPAPPAPPARSTLFGKLQSFGGILATAVQQRLTLISVDMQNEKFRLVQIVVWIGAAAFTAVMATTFASLTLVYLFWETARNAVLGGLAAFYTIAFIWIVVAFRRYLARQPKPFAASLQAFENDSAWIRKKS